MICIPGIFYTCECQGISYFTVFFHGVSLWWKVGCLPLHNIKQNNINKLLTKTVSGSIKC